MVPHGTALRRLSDYMYMLGNIWLKATVMQYCENDLLIYDPIKLFGSPIMQSRALY